MKINYVLSDTTKSATSSALMSVIKEAEANLFQDYIVIVPETKSIIVEKELLELSKNHAFANIFIYSFVRLINRLGFVSPEKMVNKQVCVLMLRKIIYENLSKLNCYKKTAKSIGFAEKMYETISQFKSSNVTFEDLKLSLESKSESLKAKLEDIIFLYEEYEKALGNELFDDLDKLSMISKFAKSSEFIKNAKIYVVGFDNITYEMVSVLKDLAVSSKEITFSSVYFNDKRDDKHIQSNDLYLKFKRVAEELKYPYNPVFFKSKNKGDFYDVQNYLFAKQSHKAKSNGNIEVFEAKNKKQEIEQVANKIIKEIKSGKRFKDIGVFVCGLDSVKDEIKECFEEFDIPYFINQSHDILGHYFSKFILDAFEIISHRCSSDKVLALVSNPLWGSDDDFAVLYKYFEETGVSYERIFDVKDMKDYSAKDKTVLNDCISRLKAFYGLFKDRILGCKKFKDYLTAVNEMLDFFEVKEKLEELSNLEKELGNVLESEICLQVFEKQQRFSQSAMNFMGEVDVSLDEFVQIYFTGFSSIKLNLAPVSIDCVIVQENTDGFYNIKDMFIIGSEEGKFPVKIDDSGIILDREIEETISAIKKAVEPTVKEINKRESFRVYEALLEPKEKLFISYSLSSTDGKAQKPSRIVLRLLNMFGNEILNREPEKFEFVNFKNQIKNFAKDVNEYLNDKGVLLSELNREYSEVKDSLNLNFKKFIENLSFDEKDFILKNSENLYFYGDRTSVSQLEKYFDCPYLFFATYGLRLKENKNAKLSSLDVGVVIHRVAELFIEKLDLIEREEDLDEKIREIVDFSLEELSISKERNLAILNLIVTECMNLCKHIFVEQKNSGFKHKKSEWSFSGDNAIKIKLDDGRTVSIEGKIDRIDEFQNYIRIIDYKTGKVESDLSSIYYGTKIQLISYLSAVTKYGDKKVAGVFYLPIHSDYATSEKMLKNMYKMEGFLLDDIDVVKNMDYTLSIDNNDSNFVPLKVKTNKETDSNQFFEFSGTSNKRVSEKEFSDVKEYIEMLCKGAIDEILSGYIEPAPNAASIVAATSRCEYCKLAGFCGLEKSKFKYGRICSNKVRIDSFDLSKKEANDGQD